MAVALISPDGLRPFIVNWREVVLYFLRGIRADVQIDGTEGSRELLARLLAFPGVPPLSEVIAPDDDATSPVVPIHFCKEGTSLRLFTTITTLGTPRDVTAQEIRIECFFPMDDATAQILQGWAPSA